MSHQEYSPVVRLNIGDRTAVADCVVTPPIVINTATGEPAYPWRCRLLGRSTVYHASADAMRHIVDALAMGLREGWIIDGYAPDHVDTIEPDHDDVAGTPPSLMITYSGIDYILTIAPRYDESGAEQ